MTPERRCDCDVQPVTGHRSDLRRDDRGLCNHHTNAEGFTRRWSFRHPRRRVKFDWPRYYLLPRKVCARLLQIRFTVTRFEATPFLAPFRPLAVQSTASVKTHRSSKHLNVPFFRLSTSSVQRNVYSISTRLLLVACSRRVVSNSGRDGTLVQTPQYSVSLSVCSISLT